VSSLLFAFIRLLGALARLPEVRLRVEAAPGAPFNIVPVEWVAAAIEALAACPGGAGGTFHLVVRDAPTQAELLATIAERLGARGVSLVDARGAPLADPSPLERAVAGRLEGYRPYLTQHVRFDDTGTRRLLDATGLAPAALSAAVLDALIDRALAGEEALAAPLTRGGTPGR